MAHSTDERKSDQQAARDAAFARQRGHEREVDRDINIRSVATTVLGILAGTVVSMIAMGLFLSSMADRAERRAPELSPIPEARAVRLPPGPRLQSRPEVDYQQFRAGENLLLSSYGWSDRSEGTVRIPIERAMELLVARGVEVMPPQPGPLGPAGGPAETGGAFGANQPAAAAGDATPGAAADGQQGRDAESGATQGRPEAGEAGTASGTGEDGGTDGGEAGSGDAADGPASSLSNRPSNGPSDEGTAS